MDFFFEVGEHDVQLTRSLKMTSERSSAAFYLVQMEQ